MSCKTGIRQNPQSKTVSIHHSPAYSLCEAYRYLGIRKTYVLEEDILWTGCRVHCMN